MDTPVGNLILVYHNPYKTMVVFHPLYTLNNHGGLFSLLIWAAYQQFCFSKLCACSSVQCMCKWCHVAILTWPTRVKKHRNGTSQLFWLAWSGKNLYIYIIIPQDSWDWKIWQQQHLQPMDTSSTASNYQLGFHISWGKCHHRRKICPLAHLFITQPKIQWKEQQINFELWKKLPSHLIILVA